MTSLGQPTGNAWKLHPLKHYKQIWPQLLLDKGLFADNTTQASYQMKLQYLHVIPLSLQPQLRTSR